jgi:hypothetical protein
MWRTFQVVKMPAVEVIAARPAVVRRGHELPFDENAERGRGRGHRYDPRDPFRASSGIRHRGLPVAGHPAAKHPLDVTAAFFYCSPSRM